MRALLCAWAYELVDSMSTKAAPTNVSWPPEWGTAGHPEKTAPFEAILLDELPDAVAGCDQKSNSLSDPAPSNFFSTIFYALTSDFVSGYSTFELEHQYSVWRVPVPAIDPDLADDDTYSRVPLGTIPSRNLLVSQVIQLRILRDFVV